MDTFWRMVAFIVNNSVTLLVIFSTCLLFGLLLRKLIRENALNRRLFRLQDIMRQSRNRLKLPRFFKQGVLAAVPVIVLGVYMVTLVPSRPTYTSHLTPIHTLTDLTSIYQAYHQKNRVGTLDMLPTERATDAPMMQESERVDIGIASVPTRSHTLHVATEDQRLYVLNNQVLQVIDLHPDSRGVMMQWPLPLTAQEEPFEPAHLFVDAGHLVVVGTIDQSNTMVLTYDRQDQYNLIHRTVMQGTLREAVWKHNNLHILLTTDLPDASTSFSMDDHLPVFTHDGKTRTLAYTDIYYVEDSEPNGFIVHYHLDLNSKVLHPEAFFTDVHARTLAAEDAFYLAIPSKRFSESTELFVVSNPINAFRTALIRLPFTPVPRANAQTRMITGYPLALDTHQNDLALLTRPSPTAPGATLEILTLDLASKASHTLGDSFAPVYRFAENTCTYVHEETAADVHHAIHWQTGSVLLTDAPHRQTLTPTTSIILSANRALLVSVVSTEARQRPDGLAFSLHREASSCTQTEVGQYVARFNDFGILSTPVMHHPESLLYDDASGLLLIPFDTYETWPAPRHMPGMMLFIVEEDDLAFHHLIRHVGETSSGSAYRALLHDTTLITVSRNQVYIWDKEDWVFPVAVIELS